MNQFLSNKIMLNGKIYKYNQARDLFDWIELSKPGDYTVWFNIYIFNTDTKLVCTKIDDLSCQWDL